jgi:hypothetical protein
MFQMDPSMMLITALQADRRRKFPAREWHDARTSRKPRRRN